MTGPDEQSRILGGRVGRVAPLVGMAGRTAGEAVVASLRNRRHGQKDLTDYHTRQAERYAERLGRSRGVLMKAGQILSFVALDPAVEAPYRGIYQEAFARLQDDAPPMPPQLAIDTITAELGRSPREVFAEFDPHPLAAASIGQVHAATLRDGRRVAVKVQYPGVEEAIRADLKNTELISTFFQLVLTVVPGLPALDVRGMAAEVADRIGEEVDYRAEAANQIQFAEIYRGHPFIRIPEVIPELSTRRVLTMEFSDGVRYAKALAAEQSLRDAWGEAIYRFAWGTLLVDGLLNADPHPGNYLFHTDGSVTFLDFGCVKRFTSNDWQRLEALTQAAIEQDAARIHRAAISGGFIDPADPPQADALLAFYSYGVLELIRPQPFTFTPAFAAEVLREPASPRGPHLPVLRRMRTDAGYVFLSRNMTGLTSVLGGLNATGPWRAIREEYSHAAAPARPTENSKPPIGRPPLTTTTSGPVHWDTALGAFVVTGFAEASAVLRGEGWSSDPRLNPLIDEEIKDMPSFGGLLLSDPPDHTRLRRLVSPPFGPKAIERLRPRVVSIVDATLDGLHSVGPEVDVLADVGYPIALAVISELLDVGVEGAQVFAEQTPILARGFEFDAHPDDLLAAAVASTELTLFLTPILAERRHRPGADFISALLALSGDHPDAMSLGEVMNTCLLLLIAGHETTANLIANSTLALLMTPGARADLLADPARAVEELLRLEGPAKRTVRTALIDHELADRQIEAGQAVLVDIQQADRDPVRFPDPLRFDLARDPIGHLAFGAGLHFCLGAALARVEVVETLTRLFTRFPHLELTDAQGAWRDSLALHALERLPVRIGR